MYKLALVLALSIQGLAGATHVDDASIAPVVPDAFKGLEQASAARSREQALRIAAKEQRFVESFNRLAAALEEFSKNYKVTHTMDPKQVKSIREAYRKLQQADPWFRAE